MSLKIPCPFCGIRSVEEFVYGEVYDIPDRITGEVERDVDRAYMLNNAKGVQREAWFHTGGCRRWVYLYRDTVADVVVEPPTD